MEVTAPARAVALLDADPDLARGIPAEELAVARRALVAPLHVPPAGTWAPGSPSDYGTGVSGLLVLRGVITRDVLLESRTASQLVGPGDVIVPWERDEPLLPIVVRWTVSGPTALAVLDERFVAAARRWPRLAATVRERIVAQVDRLAVQNAIAQLPRVELRVLALLWHLADRWGKVTSAGVLVPMKLTHETLGRLVGAQRPTVTLAVGQLTNEGTITRRQDGGWLLRAGSQLALAPEARLLGGAGGHAAGAVGALSRRSLASISSSAH
jgi:hypothetical protein